MMMMNEGRAPAGAGYANLKSSVTFPLGNAMTVLIYVILVFLRHTNAAAIENCASAATSRIELEESFNLSRRDGIPPAKN